MLKRRYGSTDVELSIIGLGGIVVSQMPQSEADAIVHDAFDRGVNYYDVAPTYADAEDRLGPALKGLRDEVFLACKTEKRDRKESRAALETSLRKLQTDHFDLYQIHGLQNLDDAKACFGPNGAMETLIEARDRGLTRFLGFSAHCVEAALYCMEQYPFDSVLFPVQYVSYYRGGFGPQVIEAATGKGMAVLALKAGAWRPWPDGADTTRFPNCWYEPQSRTEEVERAFRWTLSQPVTAAVPPGDPGVFRMALEAGERFTPMTPEEMEDMRRAAAEVEPLFRAG